MVLVSNRPTESDPRSDRQQAQMHARKAKQTRNATVAMNEHEYAAGQFAKAAKDTLDSEV